MSYPYQQGAGYPPQPGYPPQQQQGVTPYAGGYPSQGGAGYPPQPGGGYPSQPGAYPPQGGAYPPQNQYGGGAASGYPGYPQAGQPSYPSGGQPGYPQPGGQPGYPQPGGQPGYPQPGGQPSYPQAGQQPSYPQAGQPSYPQGGQPAYPSSGHAPYPGGQPSAYPASGQPAAYPSAGQPAYPTSGQPSYPSGGQPAYPSSGQPAGYPSQQQYGGQSNQYPGTTPAYPQSGGVQYPNQPAGYPATAGSGYGGQQAFGTGGGYGAPAGGYGGGGAYQQPAGVVILTPIMSAMTRFEATVHPAPNFNANADADALRKAMRGFGCDDKAVMNILCYRSNAQRQQIRQMYKTMFGKDLIQDLVSELKGNFEDLIVALLYLPEEFDARELKHAMAGIGTKESTLIEIMVTRTNAEINAIKLAYRRLFGVELEQALASETSGDFKRLLVSLTVGGRDESSYTDVARAAAQAKELYQAGEKQWGTNESAFNAIMVATNPAQLHLVFEEYRKLTGHDVEQAVKGEFSGDIEDGLLTVVKCAKNKPAYFAERANQAMKGMGTRDRDLIRVIVSRCERDMVQVKQEYQRMYHTTLDGAISGDTSGKYKEGLLALVRGR